MANLYITEQNAWIRKRGDRVVVEKDDATLLEIPYFKIDTVLLYGNVQFTTQALGLLLDHGVELALLTTSGRLRGQLTPPKAKNITLRMAQYERSACEDFCLNFARELVRGKIENSAAHLRRFRHNHPEVIELSDITNLETHAAQVQSVAGIESLRGVEGTAAARYFRALQNMVPEELGFEGRRRRPPPDPVNALLSFGYVIVGNELQALLDAIGFDPYLGFYHQVDYGRPSLALDLLEELRPALVDRLTVRILNLRLLTAEDFETHPRRGARLSRDGKKRYFEFLEQELAREWEEDGERWTFRSAFRRQAHRLARAIEHDEPYESLRLPC